jgi:ribosomal protein S15P/S13E
MTTDQSTDGWEDLELQPLEKMKKIAEARVGFINEDITVLLSLFAELEAHREQNREDRERKPGERLDEELAKIKARLKRLENR